MVFLQQFLNPLTAQYDIFTTVFKINYNSVRGFSFLM